MIQRIVIATGQVTTVARLDSPASLWGASLWGDGTLLYVVDGGAIRAVRLDTNEVFTVAGAPTQGGSEDGRGTSARFGQPTGIWSDGVDLYVPELAAIRRLSVPARGDEPTITGIMPSNAPIGSTTTFTLTGTNFAAGQTNVLSSS